MKSADFRDPLVIAALALGFLMLAYAVMASDEKEDVQPVEAGKVMLAGV